MQRKRCECVFVNVYECCTVCELILLTGVQLMCVCTDTYTYVNVTEAIVRTGWLGVGMVCVCGGGAGVGG